MPKLMLRSKMKTCKNIFYIEKNYLPRGEEGGCKCDLSLAQHPEDLKIIFMHAFEEICLRSRGMMGNGGGVGFGVL